VPPRAPSLIRKQ